MIAPIGIRISSYKRQDLSLIWLNAREFLTVEQIEGCPLPSAATDPPSNTPTPQATEDHTIRTRCMSITHYAGPNRQGVDTGVKPHPLILRTD